MGEARTWSTALGTTHYGGHHGPRGLARYLLNKTRGYEYLSSFIHDSSRRGHRSYYAVHTYSLVSRVEAVNENSVHLGTDFRTFDNLVMEHLKITQNKPLKSRYIYRKFISKSNQIIFL